MELFPIVLSPFCAHTLAHLSQTARLQHCVYDPFLGTPARCQLQLQPVTEKEKTKKKKKTDEELNDHPGKIKRNLFGGATGRASSVKI